MRRRTKVEKLLANNSNNNRARKEILELKKAIKVSHEIENKDIEKAAIDSIKTNSKAFFSYTKRKAVIRNSIGPLITADGASTTDPQVMADTLQNQFSKAWRTPSTDDTALTQQHDQYEDSAILTDVQFNEKDIEKTIAELKPTAAPGSDGIGSKILKECKKSLSQPLYILWRTSLDQGEIPAVFRQANITPIYKGGARKDPLNYRPISLTSNIIKTFERVIKQHIVKFLEDNPLINEFQHGFREKTYRLSQLHPGVPGGEQES